VAEKVFLGVGSNEGNRLDNLNSAVTMIREFSCPGIFRVSPVYETPALLPEGAPPEWNRPFLNLVVESSMDGTPGATLQLAGQGVDVLRVHDPISHIRAARAWSHLNRSLP